MKCVKFVAEGSREDFSGRRVILTAVVVVAAAVGALMATKIWTS
jgi:hypothetical protein